MRKLGSVALVFTMAACGARQVPTSRVTTAPREAPSRHGETDVRILAQPELGKADVQAKVADISPARSVEDDALPAYPAGALAASCPDGAVAIRVTVDVTGRPTLLREVPGRPNPTDECHQSFWQATAAALREWQFIPAARQVRRESADVDGDGKPDYTWMVPEPVAVYLDLEFRFRIVEGHGEVAAR